MLCLSDFELYSRWVPLLSVLHLVPILGKKEVYEKESEVSVRKSLKGLEA